MINFDIKSWQPLLRPPLPDDEPPVLPKGVLKALTCRNQITSVMALVTASEPVESAKLTVSNLICGDSVISRNDVSVKLVGTVPTPEAGDVSDPLFDVEEFPIKKSASLYISINIPMGIKAGTYVGRVALNVHGAEVASEAIEVEVANVDLPDVKDWSFFLNIWMNPGPVARWYKTGTWTDEHFDMLRPFIKDLAEHGQKTAVVPICSKPWKDQTVDPYPSTVIWMRNGDEYEFDFSIFDRYVELHEEYGIDNAIHCYSIVQGPGAIDFSYLEYTDLETGQKKVIKPKVGDEEYVKAWGAFFKAFRSHLKEKGWMDKVYIGLDEKTPEIMEAIFDFLRKNASDFRTSLAGNIKEDMHHHFDDLSLAPKFDEQGVVDSVPAERAAMGVADLLSPEVCAVDGKCPDKMMTTYYVCCGPLFPNTFIFSPLVESRMLGFLTLQGGYDGFLRWAYNDWTSDPYNHPEWSIPDGKFPTGDVMFVYPGENGPVSSLRWEQLREGIYDYELAMIANTNMCLPDEMVDYEQAIALACRDTDGRKKSVGDIELARRLLIPIAEHANEWK